MYRGDAVDMTTSLYVTGSHVASVEHDPLRDGRDLRRAGRWPTQSPGPSSTGSPRRCAACWSPRSPTWIGTTLGPSPGVRSASGSRSGPDPDDRAGPPRSSDSPRVGPRVRVLPAYQNLVAVGRSGPGQVRVQELRVGHRRVPAVPTREVEALPLVDQGQVRHVGPPDVVDP